jgi:XTP/dITP diphosphohydrolase
MRLLLATTNQDKVREIREILSDLPVELMTLQDVGGVPEPEETGETFAANARLKALYYDRIARGTAIRQAGPFVTVAEDSGLVIDALDGEPGVRSARFLREDATYPERFAEIRRRLAAVPDAGRTARFVCAIAVVADGVVAFETTGAVEGEVIEHPRGSGGFGYDPIFYYPPFGQTLAEATSRSKLAVAHRGVAFRQLAVWLGEGKM